MAIRKRLSQRARKIRNVLIFISQAHHHQQQRNQVDGDDDMASSSSYLPSAGDKLKKLQLNKKESSLFLHKETSTSKLLANMAASANGSPGGASADACNVNSDFEEIMVTIRKSERGFGFELKNGILIVRVHPNSPAFYSGIQVGDIIIKINGTCVRGKETADITNMIHESNSFVSLTLQRKLSSLTSSNAGSASKYGAETSGLDDDLASKMNMSHSNASSLNVISNSNATSSSVMNDTLKNVTNQMPREHSSFKSTEKATPMSATGSDNEDNRDDNDSDRDDDDGDGDDGDADERREQQQQNEFCDYENNENHRTQPPNDTNYDPSVAPQPGGASCTSAAGGAKGQQQHRKQHSMSEESFQQLSRNASESSAAGRRRTIKKTRSTTTPKTYQTQSLSNITSTLVHSTSDNEIDHHHHHHKHNHHHTNNNNNHHSHHHNHVKQHSKQQSMAVTGDNDQEFILNSKDDLSYTSEDNLHDGLNDKTFDLNGFGDYGQLMLKPLNTAFLLNYLLSETSESPKNLYFCLFVDELISSTEKKETLARWCQELYSTFLMNNAPLKIKTNDLLVKKIEENLEKNPIENLNMIKKYFDDAKLDAIEQVNAQLTRFREVHQMGLANLFHGGSDLIKHYQSVKSESEHFRSYVSDSFQRYINDIANEIGRVSQDWNDIRSSESQLAALICSFATYVKRFNLPIKYIGKYELDKVPTFLNKKSKSQKKNPVIPARGHNFVEAFINVRSTCLKCGLPFWGINFQGFICQKSKCELKIHRHCLNSGVQLECHGSLKSTIRTDYKEKFDNFQKILFGVSKKKDEEQALPMDTSNGSINRSTFYPTHSSSSNLSVASGSLDSAGQSVDPSAPPPIANFDQRNLPVELAIRKFESLNKRPNIPLITSPTNGTGSGLIRTNTMSSSSVSPTSSDPRLNLLGQGAGGGLNQQMNNLLASIDQPVSSNKSASNNHHHHHHHQHQILPNKHQYHHSAATNEPCSAAAVANDPLAASSKEQACKRVSSFKVDAKKTKANVTRSKSDPEPEEIKKSISSSTAQNSYRFNDRFSIDSTTVPPIPDQNEPPVQPTTYQSNNNNSNSNNVSNLNSSRPSSSATGSSLSYQQSFSSLAPPPTTAYTSSSSMPSSSALNNGGGAQYMLGRHSWMADSDMEVDEELPNLSVNIEKHRLEQMTKKEMKMQEVINELIHTEQKHVRNLKIMKFHFYVPIKMEMFLSEEERNLLFPNLDEILDLHSHFNDKLKKLRKENTIVPVKQLIDVVLQQFEGERGAKFESACATFCQNQGEAMKLLQSKMKQHAQDKFSLFLNRAENDPICRKLHLKDFIPTEVQRLVKYRLLFQELTKNATDERDKAKLEQCMNASSRISQYVNKAVTECENQKRVVEVQGKMETKEFDQYCVKSPLLAQYKNLDLTARKLIYEGELEWKVTNNVKLVALLFPDIIVFLERVAAEEKRRYVLRPLSCMVGKQKCTFTPVIPLSFIKSFNPMPADKRGFHIVVLIEDGTKSSSKSSSSSSKPIQTQILFILYAKSGEERNKWTSHLQALTGKMGDTQVASIDLTLNHQSSTSSLISLASNPPNSTPVSASGNSFGAIPESSMSNTPVSALANNATQSSLSTLDNAAAAASSSQLSLKPYENKSVGGALDSRRSPVAEKLDSLNETELRSQLIMNTQSIVDMLTTRQLILSKLLRTTPGGTSHVDFDLYESGSGGGSLSPSKQQASDDLICHSLELMNQISHVVVGSKSLVLAPVADHNSLLKPLTKLEKTLNRLHANLLQQKREDLLARLPTLQLPQQVSINEDSLSSCSNLTDQNGGAPAIGSNRLNRNLHNRQSITSFTSSEFVSSSQMSTSNAADLSEDEQITYHYNDEDEIMGIPTGNMNPLAFSSSQHHQQSPCSASGGQWNGANTSLGVGMSDNLRRLSNSSDRTLIVVPGNSAGSGGGGGGGHLDLPRSPNSSSISNDSSSDKISASDSSNKLSIGDGNKKKLKVANINELQEDELIRERVYDERGDVDADDEEEYHSPSGRVYSPGGNNSHSQDDEDEDEEDEADDDDDSVDRLTLGDDEDDEEVEDAGESQSHKPAQSSTVVPASSSSIDNDYGAQALRNIIEYNGSSQQQQTPSSSLTNDLLFDRKPSIPLLANPNSMMVDPLAPTTTLLTSPRGYSKIITSPATISSSIYATAPANLGGTPSLSTTTGTTGSKYDNQVPSFVIQKPMVSPNKMMPSTSPGQQALLSTHNELMAGKHNQQQHQHLPGGADSSDDEVKDYFSFKENFDEVSHV